MECGERTFPFYMAKKCYLDVNSKTAIFGPTMKKSIILILLLALMMMAKRYPISHEKMRTVPVSAFKQTSLDNSDGYI